MKALLFFFEDQVDRFLSLDYYIDCRGTPQKLLRELRTTSSSKKLAKYLTSNSKNPLKMIRGLTVANLLLIHSKDWFSFVEQHLIPRTSRDQWLNDKFLGPYYHFLQKCCTSKEKYLQVCTLSMRRGQAFQMLFYCTNMLHLLFKIVDKMPLLGRYYKQQHTEVICSAIETIAAQAQRLYAGFKHALTEILHRRQEYIKGKEEQAIMRGMLVEELSTINEEMKKLFLDKYFYPLGKGIGVKLFRPQEQTAECEKIIKAIVSDHENTERQKRHQQLEKTLFPGSGLVNWSFYEETLLSGPNLNSTVSKVNGPIYKDLDDIAISQDQQQQRSSPALKEEGKGRSDKETNSGTAQQKTYQF